MQGQHQTKVNKEILTSTILITVTILSLMISNTFLKDVYNYFINEIIIIGDFNIHHIVNDFLMAIFFLSVGIEIKKEILYGNLSSIKKAGFPIIAALGGVITPAIIFSVLTYNTNFSSGAGIPISTDIAFAVGIFTIFKNKLDSKLKIFLLSLAVVDDLISILVIGILYSSQIDLFSLFLAFLTMGLLVFMNKMLKRESIYPYLIIGMFLWYFIFKSGVHTTISGVLLAMCMPSSKGNDDISTKLSHKLEPICNFFILPLFAFINTGISFNIEMNFMEVEPLIKGILFGLVIGKPLGITLFSYIACKMHLVEKPKNVDWISIIQVSMLAGIGFTMSIFVTELAFEGMEQIIDISKVTILISALLSVMLSFLTIKLKPYLAKDNIKILNHR